MGSCHMRIHMNSGTCHPVFRIRHVRLMSDGFSQDILLGFSQDILLVQADEMKAGLSCTNADQPGASCACGTTGECNVCASSCPADDDPNDDEIRLCGETDKNPGQSTCGTPTCSLVCRAQCALFLVNTDANFDSSFCNNMGGGNCNGQTSVFDGSVFNGPCCRCEIDAAGCTASLTSGG